MKVTNWRRKLLASLVAGGLIAPVTATAADLNTNLITDPGFENVDTSVTCCPQAVKLNSWADGSQPGFAYNYNLNYDNGGPLAGGGTYYFTANGHGTGSDITTPGQVAQNISLSSGATGALIPTGEAAVHFSGFFSGYLTNGDYGHLHITFLDSIGGSLGTSEVTNQNETDTWRRKGGGAFVPVGTTSLRVSLFGTPLSGGPDGYIDNVDVRIVRPLVLEVNTSNGQVLMRNQSGEAISIDYYEITSAANALNATAWNSLQEQNLAGFPAGNGTGNGWEQFGGSSSLVVGESYLRGNSTISNNGSVGLGAAFNVGGAHDLMFRYAALASSSSNPTGDHNNNGIVDAADYVVWRKNDGSQAGYNAWRSNFGATGGSSGPGTLLSGFVRYVTSGVGSAAAVPEPASVWLVGIGLASLAVATRRNTPDADSGNS